MTDQAAALRRLKRRHLKSINQRARLWADELQPALREYLLACVAMSLESSHHQNTDQLVDDELASQTVNIGDALQWMREKGMFS